MDGQSAQQISIGETLPLFESLQTPRGSVPTPRGIMSKRNGLEPQASCDDLHMQAAWQLSKALKASRATRQAGRTAAKLSSTQRRKVGNAICEHLLASLREQVVSEQQKQGLSATLSAGQIQH